jgi:hypothetical protein
MKIELEKKTDKFNIGDTQCQCNFNTTFSHILRTSLPGLMLSSFSHEVTPRQAFLFAYLCPSVFICGYNLHSERLAA